MRRVYAAILLGALAGSVLAQDALAPPAGTRNLFEFSARGVQVYNCKEKDQGFAWASEAPEAVLYDAQGKEAGTHSKGPSWTLSDGSSVTGEVVAKEPSPKQGSIPWLLLRVTSHKGPGRLDGTSFVRRVDTDGGTEPESICDAAHKGDVARVPYTATYQFFGA
jgi:Protein of unknown function (DUF3455)